MPEPPGHPAPGLDRGLYLVQPKQDGKPLLARSRTQPSRPNRLSNTNAAPRGGNRGTGLRQLCHLPLGK